MAGSSALPNVYHPVRSISLPSRVHPTSLKVEAALKTLKAWQTSSVLTAVPFGAEAIQIGLVGLAELYNSIEELIHSPLTQKALFHYQNGKLVEEALDGSVTLLDTCDTARDMLMKMKEHVQTLQSVLRRRGGDSSTESDIAAYITYRKKAKKDISKSLGALKKMESKVGSSPLLDADHHLSVVTEVLREASTITISIFQYLLLFLSMPALKTKVAGWSLVSKLMRLKLLFNERGQKIVSEVGSVDLALYSLHERSRSSDAKAEVQTTQRMLETLNVRIDGLEAGLDCLFRCLVQNRVRFLNILTY